MQPLKPSEVQTLQQNADPQEVHEYQRLLSQRFQSDPDMPRDPSAQADFDRREQRLRELHQKLYGGHPAGAGP